MLATHKVFVDSFRDLYAINQNKSAPAAVLVGRYPEDTYQGGNPWPLCTLGTAEFLYDAVHQIKRSGSLTIDSDSLSFFQDLSPGIKVGTYTGQMMASILANMTSYADGFVAAVQEYLPTNGTISEQFNRTTGESTSAGKLTWSFASFITMARRRAGDYPIPWGATNALANTNLTSGQCRATHFNSTGMYSAVTADGAPNITKECSSEVIFSCLAKTEFGQNVFLLGNVTKLGGALNNTDEIILPMNTGNITTDNPQWYVDIWLRAGQTVGYQYVLQNGSDWVFERGPVRTVQVGACGSNRIARTNDTFRFPS
jgi:glucoamylase